MSRSLNASINANRPLASVGFTDSNQSNQRQLLDKPPRRQAFHNPRKEVDIADYSEMRLYIIDKSYQSIKSYSSDAIQLFRFRASFEALRIRNLISEYPLQSPNAIDHLMEVGALTLEELVGIEHLVCEDAAEQTVQERRAHIESVLKAQELLKEKYHNVVDTTMLAKFASTSSAKHVQKARTRATWTYPEKTASSARVKMGTASPNTSISTLKSNIRAAFAA